MSEFNIYIADLAAYNNGHLHGKWVDCTQGYDHVQEEIQGILKASPVPDEAEEIAIHDYDGDWSDYGVKVTECADIEELCEIAEGLEQIHEDTDMYALRYLMDVVGYDIGEALSKYEDVYIYLGSAEDYAKDFMDECMEVPSHLQSYIDYDKFAQDLEIEGSIYQLERDVLVTNCYDF